MSPKKELKFKSAFKLKHTFLFLNIKKAISPVVAVALLLVVAVVAVVGFQTWFNTYSSGIFTNTEQKSSN